MGYAGKEDEVTVDSDGRIHRVPVSEALRLYADRRVNWGVVAVGAFSIAVVIGVVSLTLWVIGS